MIRKLVLTNTLCSLFVLITALCEPAGQTQSIEHEVKDEKKQELAGPFYNLEYRLIGPAASGRVSRVTGVPGDPLTYWAATASGGIWKSVNGGQKWESVFDEQMISSTGSIAIAPSDPNVVWLVREKPTFEEMLGRGKRLSDGLLAIEQQLHNPNAEVNYDVLAGREGGAKLYSRLAWLASGASQHDGPPTQGMTEVGNTIYQEYQRLALEVDRLLTEDLARLNAQATELGIPFVVQSSEKTP